MVFVCMLYVSCCMGGGIGENISERSRRSGSGVLDRFLGFGEIVRGEKEGNLRNVNWGFCSEKAANNTRLMNLSLLVQFS